MTSLIMSFSLAKQNENQNGPKKKKYYENRTKSNGKSIKLAPAKQNLLKARFIFGAEVSLVFFLLSFYFYLFHSFCFAKVFPRNRDGSGIVISVNCNNKEKRKKKVQQPWKVATHPHIARWSIIE